MNFILVVVVLSVLSLCSAIPLDMAKDKKGTEKATVLNTDRVSHVEKRAKEVLMFGNQQNSPRIKKSDPEQELLSTSDKSSSGESQTDEGLPEKPSAESGEDRNSELPKVDKIIESGETVHPDSDSDTDSDSDSDSVSEAEETNEENKAGSNVADGLLSGDKSQLLAVQSIPVSLTADDTDKALAELNKVSLDTQSPLLTDQSEGPSEKVLPELGEQLETEKPADYDELLKEYEDENTADFQRRQALQSSPFLNYIYRRRREMEARPQRTKRELLLPEDAEQYLKGEIPEKLVSLESWPNAISQSELLEKEAPYQVVNSPYGANVGYGYQKRTSASDGAEEEGEEEESDDDEEDVPYQEVVLDGRPGYFIPAKRDFFPYSEEPVSHYSALVDKREEEEDDDEADYARLLQLARALAVQHDEKDIFGEQAVAEE